jgi:ligand-binding SRPBCC domain-containing protein
MFEVAESVTIAWPADRLFGVAVDPQVQLEWDAAALPRVEKLTEGPLGVGARYRGSLKRLGTVDFEYVEYEPGRRFSHNAQMRLGRFRHTFDFEPVDDGTRLTQRIQMEPVGIARLMAPLLRPVLRRRIRMIDDELRRYAESPR